MTTFRSTLPDDETGENDWTSQTGIGAFYFFKEVTLS